MTLFEKRPAPEVMRTSLSLVARSHTLRCDAKQAEDRFRRLDDYMDGREHFWLGDFLPNPIFKGTQPSYIDEPDETAIPVISTICIQNLGIVDGACRFVTEEIYESIEVDKRPRRGDVLLTVDGGTSIGKPVLFDREESFAIDSHVVILRPVGLSPPLLVYLLASPLGQLQFQRAESGASGQTAVTEDDIRRFRFPAISEEDASLVVSEMQEALSRVATLKAEIARVEEDAWGKFASRLASV